MNRKSAKKVYIYICAIAGILSMNPYFVWRTYGGGYFTYFVYLFDALAIVSCYKLGAKPNRVKKQAFIGLLLLICLYFITYVHSYIDSALTTLIAGAIMFLYLWMIVMCKDDVRAEIFEKFIFLFAISLIPGVFYYVLESLGVSLSIGTLYSTNQLGYQNSAEFQYLTFADYYKHYIGAVMRVNANTRFSGIYDEAGLVGTVSAMILCIRRFELKRNPLNIFVLICLVISFSMAGYILVVGYFALKWLKQKQWKLFIGIIVFAIALTIFLNMETNNEAIRFLQTRISITSTGISVVNNRLTSNYMLGFSQFTNGTIFIKLFGFGKGAATVNTYMNGSSSYLDMVYNYGYIGFALMVLTAVYLYCRLRLLSLFKKWDEFVFLIIFLVSMYQRPGIYLPYYFIILLGGQAYIKARGNKHASN